MPALENLMNRIKLDENWLQQFNLNLKKAKKDFKKIRLIHVYHDRNHNFSIESLLNASSFQISIPDKSIPSSTRIAEEKLELKPSIYFYAGRVFPDVGDFVIALKQSYESKHSGEATPFDTGGFFWEHIKSNLLNYPEKLEFVKKSTYRLKEWRNSFKMFWAAYFKELSDYWNDRPWKDDPEEIFLEKNNNEWRAWTFEIRLHDPVNIFSEVEKWCISDGDFNYLREQSESSSEELSLEFKKLMKRLLKFDYNIREDMDQDPNRKMEKWVKSEVGINDEI
jgi:hypothetical protein